MSTRTATTPGVAKFLFDARFDDAAGRAGERRSASLRSYGESELADARAAAFEEGKAAGAAAAVAAAEHRQNEALEAIARGLSALMGEAAEMERSVARHAIEVARAMVRKLHPEASSRHGLVEIEGLVARCLERLRLEPRIVVRLSDSLLDGLGARVDEIARTTGFDGRVVLLTDEELLPGDARVEWAEGGVERNGRRLWQDLDAALDRALAECGQSTQPLPLAPPSPQENDHGQ